jgi:ABC-type uncharacterized transport system permease subunit
MQHSQLLKYAVLIIPFTYVIATPAMAYIGPGAGLSAIGAFIAIVAAIIAALFGFLWYPIKRLIRKWKKSNHDKQVGRAE